MSTDAYLDLIEQDSGRRQQSLESN